MTSLSDQYFLRYWPKYQFRRVITEIFDAFSWKIHFSQKLTGLQKKYLKQTHIIFWKSTTFHLRPIVWPKFTQLYPKNMCPKLKSSTCGTMQPEPWAALKNLLYHFVPYRPLNKLYVLHSSVGWIFFELKSFFLKVPSNCKNLDLGQFQHLPPPLV